MKKNIKNAVFACCLVIITIIFTVLFLFFADLYYHKKFLKYAGLNYRGYRGKVVAKKSPDEVRIVMLGGSFVFGYGLRHYEALPAQLENNLNSFLRSIGSNKQVQVVNLAYPNEGVYATYLNLKDFAYLDYDCAIICDGYNDLGAGNAFAYRHSDPIFRIFGYMPILPLCFQEKMRLLNITNNKPVALKVTFKLGQKERLEPLMLDESMKIYNDFENFSKRLKKNKEIDFDTNQFKADRWSWYKYYLKKSIDFCLGNNAKVIVVTSPCLNDLHLSQQKSAAEMIRGNYTGEFRVDNFNLGDSFSLKDGLYSNDGLHLTAKGAQFLADLIGNLLIQSRILEG